MCNANVCSWTVFCGSPYPHITKMWRYKDKRVGRHDGVNSDPVTRDYGMR